MSTAASSWLGPFWLERQGDLESPAFVPGTWLGPAVPGRPGDPSIPVAGRASGASIPTPAANCTYRRATTIGSLWTRERALVDERGLLIPHGRGWSLDWWVRAEDQWHHPSRTRVVRQRLVGRSPVIETVLRVPGGDIVHRAAGFLDGAGRPAVLIEIENGSAVPVAVALAVRPYDLFGHQPLHRLAVDASGFDVDGRGRVHFARPPADVVTGSAASGDPAALVGEAPNGAGPQPTATIDDKAGWASAVAVFPLAHTATLRAVVPLVIDEPTPPARRGRRSARSAPVVEGGAPSEGGDPGAAPAAEQVAKGWDVQLRRGLQVELPDQKLDDAFHAARGQLLLLAADGDLADAHIGSGASDGSGESDGLEMVEAAEVLGALDEAGFVDEAASVLRTWGERQASDGAFDGDDRRMGATAAALGAVADHWRLTRDTALVDDLIGPLAKGAHWLALRRTNRRAPRDPGGLGLLPNDRGAPDIGGPGVYPRDSAMAARSLQALTPAEVAAGQPEVAEDARTLATALRSAVDAWIRSGEGPIPAAVGRPVDAGIVAALDLVADTGTVSPRHPRVRATVELLREHHLSGGAVVRGLDRTGVDPAATLRLAQVAIAGGDHRAVDDLDAVIDLAGVTVCWPTVVHPRTGGGSAGRTHDPVVTARFVRTVRRLLVRELPDDAGLALCSVFPQRWLGQSLDVRDAPTAFGRFSYSIRWHGDRPALLWELDAHEGIGPVTLTAPGLDPTWSTTDTSGETLLAVPIDPASVPTIDLLAKVVAEPLLPPVEPTVAPEPVPPAPPAAPESAAPAEPASFTEIQLDGGDSFS